MPQQTVALYTVTSGDRLEQARSSLAEALGDASLGEVDDAGVFEVELDADSADEARTRVQEAFGRAGTGDDFVIRETTEGREMPADDPRQGGDGASTASSSDVRDKASTIADAARTVAAAAGDAGTRAREAAEESGAAGTAREFAGQAQSSAAEATAQRPWLKAGAPIAGLLLLLVLLRRARG